MYTVLVCDDDRAIADSIEIFLKSEGYRTLKAHDGEQALALLRSEDVHLVIMDIMMPRMDGIVATSRIRDDMCVPIIMLSAKSEDSDKILGLGIGADDYVTKPFNPMELMARVKSQIRRYTKLGAIEQTPRILSSGGLALDTESKQVFVDGEERRMTPMEYKVLELLLGSAGRVFSIDEIYERVWNEQPFAPENTVAVHIRRIREKIEINPKEPKYLKVVWGLGYKIEKL